ncbi:Gfo/Idh/MocA family protein [Streptomyces sp. GSL17-111]|uniref:Gfo/Idh/MocA family protein n=1 Tax=Streptomyces sp. GSL17-111 TaxID=3121596 RepID=UPI0030F38272
MNAVRVVLAGIHGFGRNYLPVLRDLAAEGIAELAGVCDLRPASPDQLAGLGRPGQSTDLAELVRRHDASLAVVATPPHTHAPLALATMRAGAHVHLEKPPAASFTAYLQLLAESGRLRRAVQVGFQSLGSDAPGRVRELIASGAVGRVRGISATAAWSRDTAYYLRAPWAGLRRLPDGTDVVDGALTNPLAHAVATALAVDGGEIVSLETELYRAFDIEADDTSCLRAVTRGGLADGAPLLVAVTLAAPEQTPPVITVTGERGRISYWYTEDRVRLEAAGRPPVESVEHRTVLLRHLVEQLHAHGPEDPPRALVPLTSVRSFMQVLEAVRAAAPPVPLVAARDLPAQGGARRRVLPGITELITTAAERGALFSELPRFSTVAGRNP